LGKAAKNLYVFQRTPSSIGYRNDRPTDQEWAKSLSSGWQRQRMDNYTAVVTGVPSAEDLVDDGWTKIMHMVMSKATAETKPEEIGHMMVMADFAYMEDIRRRIDKVVTDKATAEALKPWYSRMCKRPCFHDDYLDTFNLPSVRLIDTAGLGVDRITENSIIAGGEEFPIDCLIYATGFELSAYNNDAVMPVIGRSGQTLGQKWQDGATTLHGIQVHGFPNYFILSTTQTAWGPNFPHMMNEQAIHIAYVISEVATQKLASVEVTQEAESAWVDHHENCAGPVIKMWAECTPSFWNEEGKPSQKMTRNGQYGGGVFTLVKILEDWRNKGGMEGTEVRKLAGWT
jgi:cyclohexanone monooxygenase